jgi:two-component system, LytTR family, sensor kinase
MRSKAEWDAPRLPAGRVWLVSLGAGTLFALLYTLQEHVPGAPAGHPHEWSWLLRRYLLIWNSRALLAPLIVALAWRFPLTRFLPWRLPLWLAAGVAFPLVQQTIVVIIRYVFPTLAPAPEGVPAWPLWETIRMRTIDSMGVNTLTFLVIALTVHLIAGYRESRRRELREALLEARLARAELASLRSQLQPHFLFNALHSVSALMEEDTAAARRVLLRLADLLRQALEHLNAQEVTLEQELEFVRAYLEIQRVRFADRLETRIAVSPEAAAARVPSFILQPLVENAVRHGIERSTGPGRIEIEAENGDGRMRLRVRNTGPGLSPERQDRSGLGLENTRTRLERLYGNAHRLELRDVDGGVEALVEIPLRPAEAM